MDRAEGLEIRFGERAGELHHDLLPLLEIADDRDAVEVVETPSEEGKVRVVTVLNLETSLSSSSDR